MLHFIKDNRSVIVKMIVNQIGMIFFGLMLSMATNQNNSLFLAASIFSVLFYMFLEYTVGWDLGAHDKIKLDGGRIEYQPYKGSRLALCEHTQYPFGTAHGYRLFLHRGSRPHTAYYRRLRPLGFMGSKSLRCAERCLPCASADVYGYRI